MVGQLGGHVHGCPYPGLVVLSSIDGKSQAEVDHSYVVESTHQVGPLHPQRAASRLPQNVDSTPVAVG